MAKKKGHTMISILIPTTVKRSIFLNDLLYRLNKQIGGEPFIYTTRLKRYTYADFEIIIDPAERDTIGKKRNRLLLNASGDYTCFFDDDDTPSDDYISTLREGVLSAPDCISLIGVLTTNGENPEIFEHSIRYSAYRTNDVAVYPAVKYERFPNHLNCIRSQISKMFKFPEKNWGEDTDWAARVFNSGLIRTEYYTTNVIYHYKYISNK